MDEFYLYNQLCVLEDIAGQYTKGSQLCSTIHTNAQLISSCLYRVAVIGEFKRGKSSLINALIGSAVLPTDVIPLTAAITRLTYGTQQKIIVHYKNGGSEEKTLDQLFDYATKYDRQREITAESVLEIEVKYPSVLCKNHIEILDTPGLNDNESMSEVTLSVLGNIDAAIVVISATKPLSLTEQSLILDLIRQEGIRHLIFVVTFLDALMDEEEKDRMLAFIRGRLQKEVLARAEQEFASVPACAEKARRILSSPDLFGVSSRQAMQGFVNDDKALLAESRFPAFKEALLALLTAAQSEDIPKKVEALAAAAEKELPSWYAYESKLISGQADKARAELQSWRHYLNCSNHELTQLFQGMDASLEKKGLSPASGIESTGLERQLVKIFVSRLSAIKQHTATHENIRSALRAGQDESLQALSVLQQSLELWVTSAMEQTLAQFKALRQLALLPDAPLADRLEAWSLQPFPSPAWDWDPALLAPDLRGIDVMTPVRQTIRQTLSAYSTAVNRFIASWRAVLFGQNREDRASTEIPQALEHSIDTLKIKENALTFNYLQHRKRIEDIRHSVSSPHPPEAQAQAPAPAGVWVCPECGATYPSGDTVFCQLCGAKVICPQPF